MRRREYLLIPSDITERDDVRRLSDSLFRTWMELLCAAAEQKRTGRFTSASTAAAIVRRPLAHVRCLIDAGFIDDDAGYLTMHDWDTWQGQPHPVRIEWNVMRRYLAPAVYMRDGSRCAECGTNRDLSIDHVVPIARGGTNELRNLRTLCRPCNSRKGDR